MKYYTFSLELQKKPLLYLMQKLDSYFCFGGKRIRVISMTSSGMGLAFNEEVHVSTVIKVLKIFSFLLVPIVLLALALRYILHKIFEGKEPKPLERFIYLKSLPPESTQDTISKHPDFLQNAVREVPASFFALPEKYQMINFEKNETGGFSKITFAIDFEQIIEDLDMTLLSYPLEELKKGREAISKTKTKEIELIDVLIQQECNSVLISNEAKKQLVKFMLEGLFISCLSTNNEENGRILPRSFLPAHDESVGLDVPSIWNSIFFNKNNSIGHAILTDLRTRLGMKMMFFDQSQNTAKDLCRRLVIVYWAPVNASISKEIINSESHAPSSSLPSISTNEEEIAS
ncbi:Family of unknown function (DUF648) [Chlamydia serpentis]|uniref:Uncharacterized protein n=1 Tax=Chlamydia serpentis TaxID=1967782 RepID=A0A2R8FAA8_9CHLA|nr:DUF648 domain-containing protein [Chlamydia serpentis]SPN73363.1 Family of unknown function (DUF648) [Chlamydia serpentis]